MPLYLDIEKTMTSASEEEIASLFLERNNMHI